MTLTLQEVDHLIKALETMSSYDIARAREHVVNGVSDHPELIQKTQRLSDSFDMTQRQWQEVYTIVRREQKGLLKEMWDKDHYDELSAILDELYPIAYPPCTKN